jgi:photosystem II stability/assembly factor-like uncharacterized protein
MFIISADALAQDWEQTNGPGGDINKMFFDQKKNIYVSNLKSSDKGVSWIPIKNEVYAIAPNGDLYSSVFSYYTFNSSVMRSSDKGETWDSIAPFGISSITILKDNTIFIINENSIFRSSNSGKTWDSSGVPEPQFGSGEIACDSNGVLFIPSERIWKSTDKGKSWFQSSHDFSGSITCGKKGNIFVSSYGPNSMHSSDDGETWTPLPFQHGLFASSPTGRILFAGQDNEFGMIKYSDDNGFTWKDYGGLDNFELDSNLTTALCADPDSGFYLEADGIVFHSYQSGTNPWTITSIPLSRVQSLTVASNGNLIASTNQNYQNILSISRDTGKNWLPLTGTVIDNGINFFARDSNNGVFGIDSRNIFRSLDNGFTWTKLTSPSDTTLTSFIIHPNGSLFLLPVENAIYRSNDNGSNGQNLFQIKITLTRIIPSQLSPMVKCLFQS